MSWIKPELGLVCITASDRVRFRTMTRKRLLQLSAADQEQALLRLYQDNLGRLNQALSFCLELGIRLYRMSSGLFPFSDEPIGRAILLQLQPRLQQVGQRANQLGIRLVLHPEQFVVLSSDRPEVIDNSLKILTAHGLMMDLLEQPRSPWALLNIHGGKRDRPERLIQTIRNLPDAIRLRLTLENDEYAYSATEILQVCQAAGIPMVFDAHHHVIHEQLDSYDHPSVLEMVIAARSTWTEPDWQLAHISNGCASFLDQRHSDLITQMPQSYAQVPWIEIEAKLKEQAIAKLQTEWLPGLKPEASQVLC